MKDKIILILSVVIIVQALLLVKFMKKAERPVAPLRPQAKITEKVYKVAIILDDWGYNLNNLELLRTIEHPITLAVLPNLTYSKRISEQAHLLNKQVILHLPLEPFESERMPLEKDTIMVDMNGAEIINILKRDLESLSYAVGVSNHQGSKLTRDEKIITVIFRELKKRGLFFVDSLTSKSVCEKIAKKLGVKFASRSVFLDNKLDEKYVEKQIRLLARKAQTRGMAIGIGHDRNLTLTILQKLMPELEKKEGIKFVFVSELVK